MRLTKLLIVLAIVGGAIYAAHKMGYIGDVGKAVGSSFSMHHSAGEKLYHTMKYEEAIQELQKAYKLEPGNAKAPNALVRMGDCYKQLKQPRKAIDCYEEVVAKYPNFAMIGQVEQSIEKLKALGDF